MLKDLLLNRDFPEYEILNITAVSEKYLVNNYQYVPLKIYNPIFQAVMGHECQDKDTLGHAPTSDLSLLCTETNFTEIDCSGLQLDYFMVSTVWQPSKVQVLKLNNNKLSIVPDLSDFTNLLELDLSYNRITVIADQAFTGLWQLRILTMEMNEGLALSNTIVPSTALSSLTRLKILRSVDSKYLGR